MLNILVYSVLVQTVVLILIEILKNSILPF